MIMAGRPHLSYFELKIKIEDLEKKLGHLQNVADLIGVHIRTVYRWITPLRTIKGEYIPYRDPNSAHIRRIKRLWYYHIRILEKTG